MSCYMVDKRHIAYLLEAAVSRRIGMGSWYFDGEWQELDRYKSPASRMTEVGQMLWDENHASVCHRYPEGDHLPGPIDECYIYRTHTIRFESMEPAQVLKACHCFKYQACEHDGWETSEAYAFISALESAAARSVPGYEEAEWGAPEQPQRNISVLGV